MEQGKLEGVEYVLKRLHNEVESWVINIIESELDDYQHSLCTLVLDGIKRFHASEAEAFYKNEFQEQIRKIIINSTFKTIEKFKFEEKIEDELNIAMVNLQKRIGAIIKQETEYLGNKFDNTKKDKIINNLT